MYRTMNTERAFKSLHDTEQQISKPRMTLQVLLPEINKNQWIMFREMLVDHLKLTKKQQALLDKLVGER